MVVNTVKPVGEVWNKKATAMRTFNKLVVISNNAGINVGRYN